LTDAWAVKTQPDHPFESDPVSNLDVIFGDQWVGRGFSPILSFPVKPLDDGVVVPLFRIDQCGVDRTGGFG
jgi:hypothetical protein